MYAGWVEKGVGGSAVFQRRFAQAIEKLCVVCSRLMCGRMRLGRQTMSAGTIALG